MADLLQVEALIAAHINAKAEHDRLFALNDQGLASNQAVSDALGPLDDALIALCAARPVEAAACSRRAEYLNATVPDAIDCNMGLTKAVISALVGGVDG
jgi:hypothetical protein